MASFRFPTLLPLENASLVDQLYERFLQDPSSVDPTWRAFFEGMAFAQAHQGAKAGGDQSVWQLIEAYRTFGHLCARINPLSDREIPLPQELNYQTFNFRDEDLGKSYETCGLLKEAKANLSDIIKALQETYCGSIGIEYKGSFSQELEKWIEGQVEATHCLSNLTIDQKKRILTCLNKAEIFEIFLHTKYVGQKRFSIQGGETLIPVLNEVVELGGELGIQTIVIGMPHRGRLNVLANILEKSYSMIFSEFEDYYDETLIEGMGDVKYHRGFSSLVTTSTGKKINIGLTANPSHLESVDPIVEGKVRGKQTDRKDVNREEIIPILIHGDASVSGQGVVYETMQLSQVEGYKTGGTLHLVLNNQIGFTTLPEESRSTRYCTDIAHAFGVPIFHVNAEEPESCMYAIRLALQIRQRFHCDVFLDINSYRQYGHNEGDEPAYTQPLEYQIIKKKSSIRELYRDALINQGVVEREMALALEEEFKKQLHYELEELRLKPTVFKVQSLEGAWEGFEVPSLEKILQKVETSVEPSLINTLGERLGAVPQQFKLHKKLEKLLEQRREMGKGSVPIDWAMAEHLAFATLLWEGYSVRLSGQDCQRGTFTQRHAAFVDQGSGEKYFPLSHLKENQGHFEVHNSPLSEFAVLGFELGYALASPKTLVLWEAQFGDFANGGQVIFDQYLSASAEKWQRYSGLVVLLPHGYEGQGAEHSSGRIERFLQLAGEANLQVVYPTTPALYFHLLRRQMIRPIRVPLIVFTPKSLLRHSECVSSVEDLTKGSFREILDDPQKNHQAKKLFLCSGRIYYDLIEERDKRGIKDLAIIRIEQLFPLHKDELVQVLGWYPEVEHYAWVQEEPRNMGAYEYLYSIFAEIFSSSSKVKYIGRPRSGSTASGSHKRHEKEHAALMERAFEEMKK